MSDPAGESPEANLPSPGATTPGDETPGDETAPPRRRHRRVTRQGAERDSVPGPSSDEVSTGWSEDQDTGDDSNDARLTRDVPPHW